MQNHSSSYNVIISDTSCLIGLSNIGQFELLKTLFGRVTITPEVYNEFKEKYNEKVPEWVDVKEAKNKEKVAELKTKWGIGESTSIVLASETPGSLVIIDDLKAREYALNIGLNVIGTVGIIRRAVDLNIIESPEKANILFQKLKESGFHLDDRFLEKIKYPVNSESNKKQTDHSEQQNRPKFHR